MIFSMKVITHQFHNVDLLAKALDLVFYLRPLWNEFFFFNWIELTDVVKVERELNLYGLCWSTSLILC